ncbi:MAG: hypothetical protein ACRC6M_00270, partial [Microcystaceae cyanobacterium]
TLDAIASRTMRRINQRCFCIVRESSFRVKLAACPCFVKEGSQKIDVTTPNSLPLKVPILTQSED